MELPRNVVYKQILTPEALLWSEPLETLGFAPEPGKGRAPCWKCLKGKVGNISAEFPSTK